MCGMHAHFIAVKPFAFDLAEKKNVAELISHSNTFEFHMDFFLNGLFEWEIGSAVFLARTTQRQTAL
jgi:hypothetical protein